MSSKKRRPAEKDDFLKWWQDNENPQEIDVRAHGISDESIVQIVKNQISFQFLLRGKNG